MQEWVDLDADDYQKKYTKKAGPHDPASNKGKVDQEWLLSRQRPERTCLAYLYEGRPEPGSILINVENIIGVQTPGKKITRKKFKQSRHFNNTFFSP